MKYEHLNPLRAEILRFFLVDGAKQTADLLHLPQMRPHNRRFLQRLIAGMALAGLLDTWGHTSGAWYSTSHLGYVVLVTLQHETLAVKSTSFTADDL